MAETKEITIQIPPSRPNGKIDLLKAFELRLKGLTYQDIADHFQCAKPSVHELLNKYLPDDIHIGTFRKHEPDILAFRKAQVLQHLTNDKLEELSGYQQAIVYDILNRNQRLIEGKSTSNVAQLMAHLGRDALKSEQEELRSAETVQEAEVEGEKNE